MLRPITAFVHNYVSFKRDLTYRAFESRVKKYGDGWDDDIFLYPDTDWYYLGYQIINEYIGTQIPSFLESYIDYAGYGRELSYEGYHEYSGGIIEIR